MLFLKVLPERIARQLIGSSAGFHIHHLIALFFHRVQPELRTGNRERESPVIGIHQKQLS